MYMQMNPRRKLHCSSLHPLTKKRSPAELLSSCHPSFFLSHHFLLQRQSLSQSGGAVPKATTEGRTTVSSLEKGSILLAPRCGVQDVVGHDGSSLSHSHLYHQYREIGHSYSHPEDRTNSSRNPSSSLMHTNASSNSNERLRFRRPTSSGESENSGSIGDARGVIRTRNLFRISPIHWIRNPVILLSSPSPVSKGEEENNARKSGKDSEAGKAKTSLGSERQQKQGNKIETKQNQLESTSKSIFRTKKSESGVGSQRVQNEQKETEEEKMRQRREGGKEERRVEDVPKFSKLFSAYLDEDAIQTLNSNPSYSTWGSSSTFYGLLLQEYPSSSSSIRIPSSEKENEVKGKVSSDDEASCAPQVIPYFDYIKQKIQSSGFRHVICFFPLTMCTASSTLNATAATSCARTNTHRSLEEEEKETQSKIDEDENKNEMMSTEGQRPYIDAEHFASTHPWTYTSTSSFLPSSLHQELIYFADDSAHFQLEKVLTHTTTFPWRLLPQYCTTYSNAGMTTTGIPLVDGEKITKNNILNNNTPPNVVPGEAEERRRQRDSLEKGNDNNNDDCKNKNAAAAGVVVEKTKTASTKNSGAAVMNMGSVALGLQSPPPLVTTKLEPIHSDVVIDTIHHREEFHLTLSRILHKEAQYYYHVLPHYDLMKRLEKEKRTRRKMMQRQRAVQQGEAGKNQDEEEREGQNRKESSDASASSQQLDLSDLEPTQKHKELREIAQHLFPMHFLDEYRLLDIGEIKRHLIAQRANIEKKAWLAARAGVRGVSQKGTRVSPSMLSMMKGRKTAEDQKEKTNLHHKGMVFRSLLSGTAEMGTHLPFTFREGSVIFSRFDLRKPPFIKCYHHTTTDAENAERLRIQNLEKLEQITEINVESFLHYETVRFPKYKGIFDHRMVFPVAKNEKSCADAKQKILEENKKLAESVMPSPRAAQCLREHGLAVECCVQSIKSAQNEIGWAEGTINPSRSALFGIQPKKLDGSSSVLEDEEDEFSHNREKEQQKASIITLSKNSDILERNFPLAMEQLLHQLQVALTESNEALKRERLSFILNSRIPMEKVLLRKEKENSQETEMLSSNDRLVAESDWRRLHQEMPVYEKFRPFVHVVHPTTTSTSNAHILRTYQDLYQHSYFTFAVTKSRTYKFYESKEERIIIEAEEKEEQGSGGMGNGRVKKKMQDFRKVNLVFEKITAFHVHIPTGKFTCHEAGNKAYLLPAAGMMFHKKSSIDGKQHHVLDVNVQRLCGEVKHVVNVMMTEFSDSLKKKKIEMAGRGQRGDMKCVEVVVGEHQTNANTSPYLTSTLKPSSSSDVTSFLSMGRYYQSLLIPSVALEHRFRADGGAYPSAWTTFLREYIFSPPPPPSTKQKEEEEALHCESKCLRRNIENFNSLFPKSSRDRHLGRICPVLLNFLIAHFCASLPVQNKNHQNLKKKIATTTAFSFSVEKKKKLDHLFHFYQWWLTTNLRREGVSQMREDLSGPLPVSCLMVHHDGITTPDGEDEDVVVAEKKHEFLKKISSVFFDDEDNDDREENDLAGEGGRKRSVEKEKEISPEVEKSKLKVADEEGKKVTTTATRKKQGKEEENITTKNNEGGLDSLDKFHYSLSLQSAVVDLSFLFQRRRNVDEDACCENNNKDEGTAEAPSGLHSRLTSAAEGYSHPTLKRRCFQGVQVNLLQRPMLVDGDGRGHQSSRPGLVQTDVGYNRGEAGAKKLVLQFECRHNFLPHKEDENTSLLINRWQQQVEMAKSASKQEKPEGDEKEGCDDNPFESNLNPHFVILTFCQNEQEQKTLVDNIRRFSSSLSSPSYSSSLVKENEEAVVSSSAITADHDNEEKKSDNDGKQPPFVEWGFFERKNGKDFQEVKTHHHKVETDAPLIANSNDLSRLVILWPSFLQRCYRSYRRHQEGEKGKRIRGEVNSKNTTSSSSVMSSMMAPTNSRSIYPGGYSSRSISPSSVLASFRPRVIQPSIPGRLRDSSGVHQFYFNGIHLIDTSSVSKLQIGLPLFEAGSFVGFAASPHPEAVDSVQETSSVIGAEQQHEKEVLNKNGGRNLPNLRMVKGGKDGQVWEGRHFSLVVPAFMSFRNVYSFRPLLHHDDKT